MRRQREWADEHGGGVIEGRDIGSVVFPDAELKVYLTAAPEVRADRRSKEVTDLDYEQVAADIAKRDAARPGSRRQPAHPGRRRTRPRHEQPDGRRDRRPSSWIEDEPSELAA